MGPIKKRSEPIKPDPNALKDYLKQLEKDVSEKGKNKKPTEVAEPTNTEEKRESLANAIRPLLSFLECLAESFDDGRILLTYNKVDAKKSTMKYLLLNPGARFQEILSSCRSIILAGGTMQPVEELTEQLFKTCPERVQIRSYRHVVPADAVLPLAIAKGPSGKELLFNYGNRQNKDLVSPTQSNSRWQSCSLSLSSFSNGRYRMIHPFSIDSYKILTFSALIPS